MWPTEIRWEGDMFGAVIVGVCDDLARDSLNAHRLRVYDLAGLAAVIDTVESWDGDVEQPDGDRG